MHLLDVLPDGQGGDILLLEGWLNRLWIPMSVQYLSKVNPIKTSQWAHVSLQRSLVSLCRCYTSARAKIYFQLCSNHRHLDGQGTCKFGHLVNWLAEIAAEGRYIYSPFLSRRKLLWEGQKSNICTYKYQLLAKNSFTPMRAIQSLRGNNMGKGKIEEHDTSDKTIDNSGSILRQVWNQRKLWEMWNPWNK